MPMKNFKETKLPQLIKGLIGNYYRGFNFEYTKPVPEKGII